jgi:hypothetical protein
MSELNLEAARTYLAGLGNTADEVAETLRQRGIREPAEMNQSDVNITKHCIIATALRTEFEELNTTDQDWFVGISSFRLGNEHGLMPRPVVDLIYQIDLDRYHRRNNTGTPIKYPFLLAELPAAGTETEN